MNADRQKHRFIFFIFCRKWEATASRAAEWLRSSFACRGPALSVVEGAPARGFERARSRPCHHDPHVDSGRARRAPVTPAKAPPRILEWGDVRCTIKLIAVLKVWEGHHE